MEDQKNKDIECKKDEWGGCCCDCKHQREVFKHPFNVLIGKGSITELLGYVCAFDGNLIFKENIHGYCECYTPKNNK